MGGSSWSSSAYEDMEAARKRSGARFAYTSAVRSGAAPAVTHAAMDPGKMKLDPTGVGKRESRDSDAHPETLAIGIFFDVTGSMAGMPVVLQQKLGSVMRMLIEKGYVEHPQIMFGAIGDAYSDRAPLQAGQFESGLEMDADLEKIWLEGHGGGSRHESYELVPYFFARHTSIDCFEKRGQKGYLFTMGDEKPYDFVHASHVKHLIGDTIQADISLKDIAAEVQERYHWFHLLVPQGSNFGPDTEKMWKELLGERCLTLDSPENVAEFVVMTIGLTEGKVDIDAGVTDLVSVGASANVAASVGKSLAKLSAVGVVATKGTASGLAAAGSGAIDRV